MTCKKAVFLEYNVVLFPLICSTFFGLDTAGCWVSGPSLAKHGSACYLLITVWHKIKCSAEGRPKCQHLTGWSPPAFMSQPWYTAWYMILPGKYIHIFFLIKWSSSWLNVNKIFTKNQGTSYTGCVNLCQYKSILPSCTINIQLQKATQKAISTENYNTERQDSFKIIIQKVSITLFFSKGIKKLFRCSDEISVKPVLFHRTQKFCTCPWNLVTCLTVWKPCQIE